MSYLILVQAIMLFLVSLLGVLSVNLPSIFSGLNLVYFTASPCLLFQGFICLHVMLTLRQRWINLSISKLLADIPFKYISPGVNKMIWYILRRKYFTMFKLISEKNRSVFSWC